MSSLRRWLLSVVLSLALATTLAAQTTGGIVGRVTDEAGGVLPGVTVEARSPALQGSRTAVTDGTGSYRLNLLPPGDYTVTFTGQGFATEMKQGVTVGLDKDATLNVNLRAAVTESITITSAVPVVDTTSTAVGTNLNAAAIQALPTGRNYSAVVQITPGVSSDANPDNGGQSSIAVYGSTGAENVFYIDGVNTTGAEFGFQGKELNFEFIQAVDVKTGGYEAEPGRSTTGAINDAQHALNGDPLTYTGLRSFGGKDYALRYQGILSASWLLAGQVAQHREENSVGPASAAGDVIQIRSVDDNFFQTGGFGLLQTKTFKRDFTGGSVTHYLSKHEIKLGLEYEKESANVVRRFTGGQQIDVFSNAVNPGKPVYSHFYWTTPTATVASAPVSQLTAAPQHKNSTVYLQDRWNVLPNLTVNLGVRWDRQQIIDAQGTQQIDLKKDFAPRFGLICDPGANGHSKLYASYGRYYEQIPMDLVIRSFSFERQARIFNYSPTSTAPDPGAEGDIGLTSAIFGGFTEPADPNLRNQDSNEYILGYEREVRPDLALGVKGIYRNYGEVIEDFLCRSDGTYCIGNPGRGIMQRVFTLDYSQTSPAPQPKRVYKGIELDASKRLSNHWQALASYVFSKLDGNFDGLYSPFTNVGADPNISAAYDYYDFFTNGSDLSRITNKR